MKVRTVKLNRCLIRTPVARVNNSTSRFLNQIINRKFACIFMWSV